MPRLSKFSNTKSRSSNGFKKARSTKTTKSDEAQLQCRYCDERFIGAVNLGGHISKRHPGKSEAYNKKMETRRANTLKRECRDQAKAQIFETLGTECDRRLRVFVTQLTKLFLEKATAETETTHDKISALLDKMRASHMTVWSKEQ